MAEPAPADAAVREYLSGYYEQHDDCERFKIKSIGESPELNSRCAKVYVEWDDCGDGSSLCETVEWTLWVEDGRVIGDS